MKKLFKFDIVTEDQPLKDDNFYKWLLKKEEKQSNSMDSICEYLDSIGFDLNTMKVEESVFETLGYVFDMYYRWYEHIKRENKKPVLLSSLHDQKGENRFNLTNRENWTDFKTFCPNDKLIEVLNKMGLVYELESSHYYFELINNNRLFIKYQHIIGSRFICTIENDLF